MRHARALTVQAPPGARAAPVAAGTRPRAGAGRRGRLGVARSRSAPMTATPVPEAERHRHLEPLPPVGEARRQLRPEQRGDVGEATGQAEEQPGEEKQRCGGDDPASNDPHQRQRADRHPAQHVRDRGELRRPADGGAAPDADRVDGPPHDHGCQRRRDGGAGEAGQREPDQRQTEHDRGRQPRPRRRAGNPLHDAPDGDRGAVAHQLQRPALDQVAGARVGLHLGRVGRSQPVGPVIVPAGPRAAFHPPPLGRQGRVRRAGHRHVAGPGAVEIHRGRPEVLVHAGRADPQIGLALVAEDGHVGAGVVVELELVAEVVDPHAQTRHRRGDARDQGGEVARLDS